MTNPNDPAFPSPIIAVKDGKPIHEGGGLTKREFFAAMAMQGWNTGLEEPFDIAIGMKHCVAVADALIKVLNEDNDVK